MGIPGLFLILAVMLSLTMFAAGILVLRGEKSGWVDAIWSFAVGAAGVAAALVPLENWPSDRGRMLLVAAAAAFWSLRLGLHIVSRTQKGGDDPRYAALKKDWGSSYRGKLLWFLQIQAAAALLLTFTIFLAAHNPSQGLGLPDLLGIGLLLAAVAGEGLADAQLARFAANPSNKGRVCDAGLWGLSRHPNYFFEWLGWLGYAIIAIDVGDGYLWGWLALVGPAFMYWLLVHVSGVPPLEDHMVRSRGDAYRRYQTSVNAFWPWPNHRGVFGEKGNQA